MQADDALKAIKSIDENQHCEVERQVEDHLKKLSQIKCGFRKLHTNENYHIVSLCIQADCQQPLGGKPGVCRDMCLRCLTQKHRSHTSISFEELAEFAIANKILRDRALAQLKEEKLKQINEYQAHHNKLCEEAKKQLESTFESLTSDKGVEALYQNYRNTIDIFNANPIPESADDPEWQAAQNKCRQAVLDLAQFTSNVMYFEKKDGEDGKYILRDHKQPEELKEIIKFNEEIKQWYIQLFEKEMSQLNNYIKDLVSIEEKLKDSRSCGYKFDLDYRHTEKEIAAIEEALKSGTMAEPGQEKKKLEPGLISKNLDDIKRKKLEQTLRFMQQKSEQIKTPFMNYCAEIKQRQLMQEETQSLEQKEKEFFDTKTSQEKKILDLMEKCDELKKQAEKLAQTASKQQQPN